MMPYIEKDNRIKYENAITEIGGKNLDVIQDMKKPKTKKLYTFAIL